MRKTLLLVLLLLVAACGVPEGVNERLPAQGNEPFFLEGDGEKGIVLLHGLTATPWEVRPLGNYLHSMNITVIAPVLPGHGTSPAQLNEVQWEDWYQHANESLTQLKNRTRKVYVGGVSTGADIALLLAEEHELDGLVVIATPIDLRDSRTRFARLYKFFLPYVETTVVGEEVGHYYSLIPSNAVAELVKMINVVKTVLPRISEPVLILQSLDDKTVQPKSAEFVFRNIGSPLKEWRLYGNASHVLVQEDDAPDVIFQSVAEFVAKN